MADLSDLESQYLTSVAAAETPAALEDIRVAALGKKGELSLLMKDLGTLSPDERRARGQALNEVKERLSDALSRRRAVLEDEAMNARLASEKVDVTLPPLPERMGSIHPISQVMEEAAAIFSAMGFHVAEGPDIEDDFHNFSALNIPPSHPARQMQDTFYLAEHEGNATHVLRTHTSPVQIRAMEGGKPPFRVISMGRVYRSDWDQTHTPMFHQIEGLVIDRETHMGHLRGCLEEFAKTFFEVESVKMRFRPSYFPFTEPSAEVDIGCKRSRESIEIGAGDDWLEILGCGMVHPNVLQSVGLDPDEYQGFAFGMGIDRIAMLKYGIADLRGFFEADCRWLSHYGFAPFDIPSLMGGLSR
jgi:phenylalanyl-tRNA synthetase alpha chain